MSGQKRLRHCEHYNGRDLILADKKVCTAGVDVLALTGGAEFGWLKRMPCYEGNTDCTAVCDKREFPSWETVRARREDMDRAFDQVVAVRKLIPEFGASGTVECPRCTGSLHWSRASSNGHIHGQCSTVGCLSWME